MGLFNKKKKETSCGCNESKAPKQEKIYNENGEEMAKCSCGSMCKVSDIEAKKAEKNAGIKVLGSGCKKCNQLEESTKEALAQLGMDTTVDHVTDFAEIATYGVMSTPALVVDGKVVSMGKVLSTEEAVEQIKLARG